MFLQWTRASFLHNASLHVHVLETQSSHDCAILPRMITTLNTIISKKCKKRPTCYAQLEEFTDMDFPDFMPNTNLGDNMVSSTPSVYYVPQDETFEPLSQLVYQHALRQNMQWWRILSFCRAQMRAVKSRLVRRGYSRILLPKGTPTVPLFMHILRRYRAAVSEIGDWFQHMETEYGTPLLMLLLMSFWIQGFRCFPWLAVFYHLKHSLQADPAMLQFMRSTVTLPMVAKPIYGIISDAIYIKGARRMPYLMIAGVIQMLSWSMIAINPALQSSIFPLIGMLVVSNIGAAIAEVVNDALVAESVHVERGHSKGELLSFVWLALAAGGAMGNFFGSLALSISSSESMFTIFSVIVGLHLVLCAMVKEQSFGFRKMQESLNVERKRSMIEIIQRQAMNLFGLISRPEIRRPLLWFSASYAVIPALSGSLFFYQTHCLKINPKVLGFAKVVGQVGLLASSLLYNRWLKKISPRWILGAVQLLLSIFMFFDIILVTRLNVRVGIADHIFVLGTSAFVECIAQFKVLPFTVLFTQLCPGGSEGSLLAVSMSCYCLASVLSGYLGSILASVLQLSAGNFTGLPLGILIQSLSALSPLLFVSCIPHHTKKLAK